MLPSWESCYISFNKLTAPEIIFAKFGWDLKVPSESQ